MELSADRDVLPHSKSALDKLYLAAPQIIPTIIPKLKTQKQLGKVGILDKLKLMGTFKDC